MLENSSNTVEKMMNDVGVVVKDHFSRLIFKMNEENKCVQSTIDYIKNMPIVLKLEQELKEARDEIERLKSLLGDNDDQTIQLKMQEITDNNTTTNYDEISKLVIDKVNEKENKSVKDFMSMYLNNQESDEDSSEEEVEKENNTQEVTEEKSTIEIPQFLGLPKLDLDGAECSNTETSDESSEEIEAEAVEEDVTEESTKKEAAEEEAVESTEEEQEEATEEEVAEEAEEFTEEEQEEATEEKEALEEAAEEVTEVEQEEATEEEEAEDVTEEATEEESVEEEVSEEELEVDEVEIDGKMYFATDDKNGTLYSVDEDGDIGDEIGYLKNGKAFFS